MFLRRYQSGRSGQLFTVFFRVRKKKKKERLVCLIPPLHTSSYPNDLPLPKKGKRKEKRMKKEHTWIPNTMPPVFPWSGRVWDCLCRGGKKKGGKRGHGSSGQEVPESWVITVDPEFKGRKKKKKEREKKEKRDVAVR